MLDGSAKGKWPAFLLSAILLVCRPPTAFAQTTARGPDFEAVTDQYMEKVLSEYHVAGAAVSVVKDGEVLFQKGYGYADLEDNVPVNGETTAFQIASVTKLFTATAVMQMVEQGALDLDTDVNQYLTTFQIENEFDTPVTLRHLLTHTAGLDDRMPLYIQSAGDILFDDLEPLEAVVRQSLPPVVREPGAYCQYNVMG
ncbi:MAG: beta-lactamase family protein, partial [Oscillospiraceae bacterium]|nr:beta-lactamase family protein [Oscillospiraceae bacterium]